MIPEILFCSDKRDHAVRFGILIHIATHPRSASMKTANKNTLRKIPLFALVALLIGPVNLLHAEQPVPEGDPQAVIRSGAASFRLEKIATGFNKPWSMAFLNDDTALVGDRDLGTISRIRLDSGVRTEISGLPKMLASKKLSAGVFDITLHPDYAANGWIYVCYSIGTAEGSGLAVDRFRLDDNRLVEQQPVFKSSLLPDNKWHFGGRMVFSGGYLFVSVGDGYNHMQLSQDLSAYSGKVLRIHDDGRIPNDNPFVGTAGALPEIWSYGVRNAQGMTAHPVTGEVWISEHGPQGGDEVNIMRRGLNYGWPVITYGEEYGGGPIGDGITHYEGMQQPVYYYTPSIAPSGLEFYTGDAFPGWKNSIFTGALAFTHINRLVLEGNHVIHEERLLNDHGWRIRFIEQGPDGYLYFGADDGVVRRMVPAPVKDDGTQD